MDLSEPLSELFTRSKRVVLDFGQLSEDMPETENIQKFFESMIKNRQNPRLPNNRQMFNDRMLKETGYRYLVGIYGEDRIAMLADTPSGSQGRTIHMAVDIFARDLEPIYAPCEGEIITSNYEPGFGEYGNYLIFQPHLANWYFFLGHLSGDRIDKRLIKKGQLLAHLGDFTNNENGGWSRHLHLQILKKLPPIGKTPMGYSSKKDFRTNSKQFPNPIAYFPKWQIA